MIEEIRVSQDQQQVLEKRLSKMDLQPDLDSVISQQPELSKMVDQILVLESVHQQSLIENRQLKFQVKAGHSP